jgi:hypothetical protein
MKSALVVAVVAAQVSSTPMETFGHRTPDVAIAHAFGPVEVTADLGDYAELHLALSTHGIPESVEIYALSGAPQKDDSLHEAQGVVVGHRNHIVPGQLALAGAIGAVVSENRLPDTTGMLRWTEVLSGFVNARVEIQLMPQLALLGGASGGAPIVHASGPNYVRSASGGLGILYALGTWDL